MKGWHAYFKTSSGETDYPINDLVQPSHWLVSLCRLPTQRLPGEIKDQLFRQHSARRAKATNHQASSGDAKTVHLFDRCWWPAWLKCFRYDGSSAGCRRAVNRRLFFTPY
jgi:hypothetical protein